jgi:putative ferrous iron transport protein C
MSLLEIKQYLIEVKISSLANLCTYFKCESDLLRCMMKHWMSKGKVRCFTKTANCGKVCSTCDLASVELYEWVGV